MKTYTLIFALSFISSIAFGQAKVSSVGTLAGSGGGAAAASYAATGKAISPLDTAKKSINPTIPQKAVLLGGAIPGASVISSAKQTQGTTFGEKVNQGLHAAGSAVTSNSVKVETKVAKPGTPIGGIIVKGGN